VPERLGEAVLELTTDDNKYDAGIDAAHRKAGALDQKFQQVSKTLGKMGRSLTTFVTTPLLGLGGIAAKLAGDFEQQQIAFEVMLGSAERATALLDDLTSFAARTPFQFSNLSRSAETLMAFGTGAEDVVNTITKLGNAARGNQGILDRLTLAYGKLKAQGRASLEELNMFTEAGVPILAALAKQYDVTTAELFKMITTGVVGFEDVDKALTDMTTGTGQFANLIEKQAASMNGLISTVRDKFEAVGRAWGKHFVPIIKAAAQWAIDFGQKLEALDPRVVRIGIVIAGLAAAIGPLVLAVSGLIKVVRGLGIAMKLLVSPWGLLIAAVVVGTILIVKHWDLVKSTAQGLWKGLRSIWKGIGALITGVVQGTVQQVKGWFVDKFDTVRAQIEKILTKLTNAWIRVKNFFADNFGVGEAGALIPIPDAAAFEKRGEEMIKAGRELMEQAVSSGVELVVEGAKEIGKTGVSFAQEAQSRVTEAMAGLKERFGGVADTTKELNGALETTTEALTGPSGLAYATSHVARLFRGIEIGKEFTPADLGDVQGIDLSSTAATSGAWESQAARRLEEAVFQQLYLETAKNADVWTEIFTHFKSGVVRFSQTWESGLSSLLTSFKVSVENLAMMFGSLERSAQSVADMIVTQLGERVGGALMQLWNNIRVSVGGPGMGLAALSKDKKRPWASLTASPLHLLDDTDPKRRRMTPQEYGRSRAEGGFSRTPWEKHLARRSIQTDRYADPSTRMGAAATFEQQRPIEVNVNVHDNQVFGGNLREFAQLLKDEFLSIAELGL